MHHTGDILRNPFGPKVIWISVAQCCTMGCCLDACLTVSCIQRKAKCSHVQVPYWPRLLIHGQTGTLKKSLLFSSIPLVQD
jgi:hypothetical protein